MGSTIKLYRNSLSAVVIIVQHALCLAVTLGVRGVFALVEFLTMAEKVRRARLFEIGFWKGAGTG